MIALGLLADEIDAGGTREVLSARLARRPGWLWGGMLDWSEPQRIVASTRRDVGQAGVARAFSAFDLFIAELTAEIDAWSDFSGRSSFVAVEKAEDEADRVYNLYARFAASSDGIADIWRLYRYFRFAPDCVVHRNGLASQGMVSAFEHADLDPMLNQATLGVATGRSAREARTADRIHATSGAGRFLTLRRIAIDLTAVAARRIGFGGIVYLAPRRAFMLDDDPLPEVIGARTMSDALQRVIARRYRIADCDAASTITVLIDLDLKERCSARFDSMRAGMAEARAWDSQLADGSRTAETSSIVAEDSLSDDPQDGSRAEGGEIVTGEATRAADRWSA